MATLIQHAAALTYVLSQRLVGADRARALCIEALDLRAGERILDIGCGPAYYFGKLPGCEYHGFDTNAAQIAVARSRFGAKATFYDEPYSEQHQRALGPFDGVLLLGLLHHLDDEHAAHLLRLVAESLSPRGRVVALDTALWDGQSRLARLMAKNDRGDYIRNPRELLKLAKAVFRKVESRVVGDTLRMPFSHFLMAMSDPHETEVAVD